MFVVNNSGFNFLNTGSYEDGTKGKKHYSKLKILIYKNRGCYIHKEEKGIVHKHERCQIQEGANYRFYVSLFYANDEAKLKRFKKFGEDFEPGQVDDNLMDSL